MVRIALAKPNARSSHRVPTPQGAGVAVIAATLVSAVVVIALAGTAQTTIPIAVFGATLFIAAVGFADDINSIPVVRRLLLQGIAVAAVILAAPESLRIVPACPLWIERGLLLLAGLWFVNLVNFMDGIDLISAVETIAVTLGVALLAAFDVIPAAYGYVAAALLGAMAGFAPWNRPPARLFLGDAGSIPIGLLLAVLLIHVAGAPGANAAAAAVILPLYYLADATLTLLRRLLRGEKVWQAHREHFYQQATRNGFSVTQIVGRIALLDAVLVALALGAALHGASWAAVAFVIAAAAVGLTLRAFAKERP
jgi:UDP-N-acetylmuramyl pentapeptide phosphotransferase/UDP-N-acetylglucosamine-1-phosphate transferase